MFCLQVLGRRFLFLVAAASGCGFLGGFLVLRCSFLFFGLSIIILGASRALCWHAQGLPGSLGKVSEVMLA